MMRRGGGRGGSARGAVVLVLTLAVGFSVIGILKASQLSQQTTAATTAAVVRSPSSKADVATLPPPLHTAAPSAPVRSGGGGGRSCGKHATCYDCLSASTECVWCANARTASIVRHSGFCTEAAAAVAPTCDDVEDNSCPAVLLERPPANLRVIHVGIQKGGPEALIQLHMALLFWGFETSLDTRNNKQGMGIKPFFKTHYKSELSVSPPLRWFDSYDHWLTTGRPNDVFIATETWKCKAGLRYADGRGRQLQWHLTVWKKNPREDCAIAAHTRYIAKDYMQVSLKAVMYPYISPHIHALATEQERVSGGEQGVVRRKTNLVLYDADAGVTDKDFVTTGKDVIPFKLGVAKGLKPEALYDLYSKAKVCIDMKMPGAERFVYEAALFGCCIITDRDGNGQDESDLPIPARFRIAPNSVGEMNKRVQEILRNYTMIHAEYAPLRDFVKTQRTTFLRQVRRYFSENLHVVGFFVDPALTQKDVLYFILAHTLALPFATVEVVLCAGTHAALESSVEQELRERTLLAAVKFTRLGDSGGACGSFQEAWAAYNVPHPERVQHVLAYRDVTAVPAVADAAAVLATQLRHEGDALALAATEDGSVLFAKAASVAGLKQCYTDCPGVVAVTADSLYRRQASPLFSSLAKGETLARSFLCEHPYYAATETQQRLPDAARCP